VSYEYTGRGWKFKQAQVQGPRRDEAVRAEAASNEETQRDQALEINGKG
jgi:hypothetical protein